MSIASLAIDDPQTPEAFTAALADTGFAVLTGDVLPVGLLGRVRTDWLAFFSSPDRFELLHDDATQDGYHPMSAAETALGASVRDLKEFFHWYPWGRQPTMLTSATSELFDATKALASRLLGWLDTHAEAVTGARVGPPGSASLVDMLSGGRRTLLRVAHYPAGASSPVPGAVRAAPHEDIDLLTVLPAANEPGLEVRDRHGAWLPVPSDEGTVTINAGDMLQLLTGGAIRSATHRVVNPSEAEDRPRLSTPLFVHPMDDTVLGGTTTAFDFQRARLRAIRGIELQRLP